MKRLLSLLTLTALLATTACSAGEGSAVLSGTTGTSAPSAATAATTSEEPPEPEPEPEPEPDYPTVILDQVILGDILESGSMRCATIEDCLQFNFFWNEKLPSALCVVTLMGLDEVDGVVWPSVRIDRILMKNQAFNYAKGDRLTVMDHLWRFNLWKQNPDGEYVKTNNWTKNPDGSYTVTYYEYDLPTVDFGRQYFVYLEGPGTDGIMNDTDLMGMASLSLPLPKEGECSTLEELEAYLEACDDRLYPLMDEDGEKFDPEESQWASYEGRLLNYSMLRLFYNQNLHEYWMDPLETPSSFARYYDEGFEKIRHDYAEEHGTELEGDIPLELLLNYFLDTKKDAIKYLVPQD